MLANGGWDLTQRLKG
jgi:hypothetical protein